MLNPIPIWRKTTIGQTKHKLIETTSGYRCALGVLLGEQASTKLQASKFPNRWWREHYNICDYYDTFSYKKCPYCIEELSSGISMIVHWNDSHSMTFSEIADATEKYSELVFGDKEDIWKTQDQDYS